MDDASDRSSNPALSEGVARLQETVGLFGRALRKGSTSDVESHALTVLRAVADLLEVHELGARSDGADRAASGRHG